MISNAKIINVNLGFSDIQGEDGRNFKLSFQLELSTGGFCTCDLNPYKLPQFLELLEIDNINQIEGCYVQVSHKDNHRPNKLKNILSNDSDEWFYLDNGIYFGSYIRELKK